MASEAERGDVFVRDLGGGAVIAGGAGFVDPEGMEAFDGGREVGGLAGSGFAAADDTIDFVLDAASGTVYLLEKKTTISALRF